MTPDSLIAFARTLGNQPLQTRRGKPFRVSVVNGQIVYARITEDANSLPRPEGTSALNKTVAHYQETRSLLTTDYQSFSVNASYTLTLIQLYQQQNAR